MIETMFDNFEYVQKALLGFLSGRTYPKPGSFFCSLLAACFRADSDNMERLRLGFPVVVGAVKAYQKGIDIDKYEIIKRHVKGV